MLYRGIEPRLTESKPAVITNYTNRAVFLIPFSRRVKTETATEYISEFTLPAVRSLPFSLGRRFASASGSRVSNDAVERTNLPCATVGRCWGERGQTTHATRTGIESTEHTADSTHKHSRLTQALSELSLYSSSLFSPPFAIRQSLPPPTHSTAQHSTAQHSTARP